MPLARRGPKSKTRRNKTDNNGGNENNHAATSSTLREAPRSSLQFPGDNNATPAVSPVTDPGVLDPSTLALSLGSSASWSSTLVDPALSLEPPRQISPLQRWEGLARSLHLQDPSADLERTVNQCFDLFLEYLFPLIPLVHEPSLRDGLQFFVNPAGPPRPTAATVLDAWQPISPGNPATDNSIPDHANNLKYPELYPDRIFTLITAVCAEAAFLLPKEIFPEGERIAELFLLYSRSCLRGYLEADLEYPDASSVAVRYFHSNCLHAAGKSQVSWHIFGEAARLVQVMKMHDGMSMQGLSPVEAELRRRTFWIVYVGDKSAAILNSRPINIHKLSFDSGITTAYPSGVDDGTALSPGNANSDVSAQGSFIAGFNANVRLWQTAADLILEIRLLESQNKAGLDQQKLTIEERHRLDRLYVLFITSLDKLPPYLRADAPVLPIDNSVGIKQHEQRIIQWANLHISLPCLRMVIDKRLDGLGYYTTGMEHPDMQLLKKTEIARDMLRVIREAPFWSLQVNGEPCVCLEPNPRCQ